MAFQLTIKHNLETSADLSEAGDVRRFARELVRVGSGADCECRVESNDLAALHFTIASDSPAADLCFAEPAADCVVYLGSKQIQSRTELLSGAELRVGHWTFKFHKDYGGLGSAKRRPDRLALAAKILVAVILILEIFVVSWLPRHLQGAAAWDAQVSQEQALLLLDQLRGRTYVLSRTEDEPLVAAAAVLLRDELDLLARQVREKQTLLSRQDWRQVYLDLSEMERIVNNVQAREFVQPLPEIDLDAAFDALIRNHERE